MAVRYRSLLGPLLAGKWVLEEAIRIKNMTKHASKGFLFALIQKHVPPRCMNSKCSE